MKPSQVGQPWASLLAIRSAPDERVWAQSVEVRDGLPTYVSTLSIRELTCHAAEVGESPHLIIPATISRGEGAAEYKTEMLVDNGANSQFVSRKYMSDHPDLPIYPLKRRKPVTMANGARDYITHFTEMEVVVGTHYEKLAFYVAERLSHEFILGMNWLQVHDVRIRARDMAITFYAASCNPQCLPTGQDCTVYGRRPLAPTRTLDLGNAQVEVGEASLGEALECDTVAIMIPEARAEELGIAVVDEDAEVALSALDLNAITKEDFDKFIAKTTKAKAPTDPATKVPEEWHEYLDVFSQPAAEELPEHNDSDHKIEIQPGAKLPHKNPYRMTREENIAVQTYVDDMLKKGFIRPSRSETTSPVIIVRKPGGGLRICVDYRALNAVTIKNRYPIPQVRETLNRLCSARIYTKFDIIAAFNRIRIAAGHEKYTAFTTRYGSFEYLVMPFGLCNAPSTFQSCINTALQDVLDKFCTAYLDDILIFSDNMDEHRRHIREVLTRLRKARLYVDVDKSEFYTTETKFLGMIVSTSGLKMDPEKVKTVESWSRPRNARDILAFLGFANFYRRFILGFGRIAFPLTELTKKDRPFVWTDKCQEAFETLKKAFCSNPVLVHFDPERETWVEVDASDYVVAGVLSQKDQDGVLHPVAYFSKKMSPAECNYEIYDKELLAIVKAFEEWRPELAGTSDPVKVLSDHRSLEYFMSTKQLNRRQARWSEYLNEFNFQIQYRPGKQGTKPDALTRRGGDLPEGGDDARTKYQQQTILKPQNLGTGVLPPQKLEQAVQLAHALIEEDFDLQAELRKTYTADQQIREILSAVEAQTKDFPLPMRKDMQKRRIAFGELSIKDNLLYYKQNQLWVPKDDKLRLAILQQHHDHPISGHQGQDSTFELVSRSYFWPGLYEDVTTYVSGCHQCKRNKAFRHSKFQGLRSLPVPKWAWSELAVDFVVELPGSKAMLTETSYTNIMVVTDRLTKYKRFVAVPKIDARTTAQAFLSHVWKDHGLPNNIVSDRGSAFISEFWKTLCERLQVKRAMSTAYHPQTDGQSENTNQQMEQYLREYVGYLQDDWVDWLPMAEFAANNHVTAATKCSPFFAVYGRNPRMGFEPQVDTEALRGPMKFDHQDAEAFASQMEELHRSLREAMTAAQAQYEKYSKGEMPPVFHPGDKIWLDTRNIKTRRPSKKLDQKNAGPFSVVRAVNPFAYEIQLPATMKIHNVFHVSLLRPHLEAALPLQAEARAPPPPIEADDEPEYEVEKVVDAYMAKRRKQECPCCKKADGRRKAKPELHYEVQWKGYAKEEEGVTVEPWNHLLHATKHVWAFHQKYPDKPRQHDDFPSPDEGADTAAEET